MSPLRTVIDLKKLNGGQFIARLHQLLDGGTRTTSIEAIAISLAVKKLLKQGVLEENPNKDYLTAIS